MVKKFILAAAGLGVAVVANIALAVPETVWVSAGDAMISSVNEPAPFSLMVAGAVSLVLVRKRLKQS